MVRSPIARAFPLPKSSVPNLKNPAPFVKKTSLSPQFISLKSPAIIVPRNSTDFTNAVLYADDTVFAQSFGIDDLPSEVTLRQLLRNWIRPWLRIPFAPKHKLGCGQNQLSHGFRFGLMF